MVEQIVSFSQQQLRIWSPDAANRRGLLVGCCRVRAVGALDRERLETALDEVVTRHEMLRTTLQPSSELGAPSQLIHPQSTLELVWQDATSTDGDPRTTVDALAASLIAASWALDRPPVLRCGAVAFGDDVHELVLVLPALCGDRRSLLNLVAELARALTGENELDEPVRYADFVAWQEDLLADDDTAAGRSYWREIPCSRDRLSLFSLPEDEPWPPGGRCERSRRELPVPSREALDALCEKHAVSSEAFLLAVWQSFLGGLSGRRELLVGTAFAGRPFAELEDALGLFARYLPVPATLRDGLSVVALARRLDDTLRQHAARQELFSWDAWTAERDAPSSFAAVFEHLRDEPRRFPAGELELTISELDADVDRFTVALTTAEHDDVLMVELRSVAALDQDAAALLDAFLELLERAIADPELASAGGPRPGLTAPTAEEASESVTVFRAPQTPEEQHLAEIWSALLGVEKVGLDDDFFALGGHSLLAAQIAARARRAFGVELVSRVVFEHRRLGELAAKIRELRGEDGEPALVAAAADDDAPQALSFAQERLWLLHQLAPEDSLYNERAAFELDGQLDLSALAASLEQIIRRHDVLRATFHTIDGRPAQRITGDGRAPLTVIDLRDAGSDDTARLHALAGEWVRRPFDLEHGPLWRCALLRLEETRSILLVTVHHIVWDGWSYGVFLRELTTFYRAVVSGEPAPLPAPRLQYGDYVRWQRRRLRGAYLDELMGYWREQLTGMPEVLELPTDRPRPAILTFRGAVHGFPLSATLTTAVDELARRFGVTRFIVLLTVFKALLNRYTGGPDLAVGTPIANREPAELEDLIGVFVNVLVLRTRLTADESFAGWLARVEETALGAYAHQDMPFERLVDELQPRRDLAHSPLFQVMLILQNAPLTGLAEVTELRARILQPQVGTGRFDLQLEVREGEDELFAIFDYNRELFFPTTIARLAEHFKNLLGAAATAPERAVATLPLLSAAEQEQLSGEWQGRALAIDELGVDQLIARQAMSNADRIAVVTGDGLWSYRALLAASDDVALQLREMGVERETRVGVSMSRSPAMVMALLGVWKAGGAYVPMDPDYPAERLRYMIADAELGALITEDDLTERLATDDLPCLLLDRPETDLLAHGGFAGPPRTERKLSERGSTIDRTPLESEDRVVSSVARVLRLRSRGPGKPGLRSGVGQAEITSAPVVAATWGEQLAYVIYTSGSTGKPKGVQIAHRTLVNFLRSMAERPGLDAADVLLAVTSLSFDIAALELWLPLLNGARVELVSSATSGDGEGLARLLDERRATVMQATPATWRLLLVTGWRGRRELEILCGGEALPRDLAGELLARGNGLWNLYGPTETTVWSAVSAVGKEDVADGVASGVAIGRPIHNTRIELLDRHLERVPVGAAGELYIGGDGLARGYLKRPVTTAERFLPDACSGISGARLYRTGDVARRRGDGRLEFLARVDHQIKLRGYRIELGEIEAVLRRHPRLAEAAVALRDDLPGGPTLVAYTVVSKVPADSALPTTSELRDHLGEALPPYMVPSFFVELDALPLTPNRKVDRRALPPPPAVAPRDAARTVVRGELEETLAELWREVLGVEEVGRDDNFFELGGHSLLLAEVHARLRQILPEHPLTLLELFRFPTLATLAEHLRGSGNAPPRTVRARGTIRRDTPIAIVGMSGRFPGAADLDELWRNLAGGVESIRQLSSSELDPRATADPSFVPASAPLDGPELFDAAFFGFSPREAELLDPQHRLFLENAWHALEDAGLDPRRFAGRVGVYAGSGMSRYARHLFARPDVLAANDLLVLMFATGNDYLASRVSYKLDLDGPSVVVQSACSTSLVAVHLARQALLDGDCDAALAGGITLVDFEATGYRHTPGGILSPDGHCRPFDADARGTVFASGVGVVVLKRLDDAVANGDRIRAVIKGTAINNDGALKVGYTAPSEDGQAAVITAALAAAEAEADSISYVETHGTGTALGDPIELAALERAFAASSRRGFCAVGSVKSNLGHTDTAAGAAGLIKTTLALEHEVIPPSLHFTEPNPAIDFVSSRFFVNAEARPWPRNEKPRRAGVSSFGIGGTNAHVVLEEAPTLEPSSAGRTAQLLVLSARSTTALDALSERLAHHLAAHPEEPLADVAFTLQLGRTALPERRIVVAGDPADAVAALGDPKRLFTATADGRREVVFLFPGQGAQAAGMGRRLYATESVFRTELDRSVELLTPHLGLDLREVLFNPAAGPRIDETWLTQPALFAVEHALARQWMAWGVRPAAMLGHSIGEVVAACLAGVMTLPDALALVAARGRLMQELPRGAMLAVPVAAEEVRAQLGDDVAIAAENGPRRTVLAGTEDEIAALAARLREGGIESRRVTTSHAFHSPMMEPIVERFTERVRQVELAAPTLPYLSNVTGTWITSAEATDPEYWAAHLRSTVRFAAAAKTLLEDPRRVFLEVGPGHTVGRLVRQQDRAAIVLASQDPADGDDGVQERSFFHALGQLWAVGIEPAWEELYRDERRQRVALPGYPFERQRFWIEAPEQAPAASAVPARGDASPGLFHAPFFKPTPLPAPLATAAEAEGPWLIFADDGGIADAMAEDLTATGRRAILVVPGDGFARLAEDRFEVRPGEAEDYRELFAALDAKPRRIAHLWSLSELDATRADEAGERLLELGFYSLLALGKALGGSAGDATSLVIATRGLESVAGEAVAWPEMAAVLGPCKVLPRELPGTRCLAVDLEPGLAVEIQAARLLAELGSELADPTSASPVVAYRGGRRFQQDFAPIELGDIEHGDARPRLREGGVYLITGGLGGLGLTLARHLAARYRARLVLIGRSADSESAAVRELSELGGEALVLAADVADRERMAEVLAAARERFGALDGVIHAAGIAGGGVIQTKERTTAGAVLRPKVAGTRVLLELLGEERLDFVLLFSSVTGLFSVFGQVDYAAANNVLDAWARKLSGERPELLTVAVDWPPWAEVGMAAATADDGKLPRLEPSQGIAAFEQILAGAYTAQVVVVAGRGELAGEASTPAPVSEPPAVPLTTKPSGRDELVVRVKEAWRAVLGVEEVEEDDDFFAHGGDSLAAMQLFDRLRKQLGVTLSLATIFEAPTVARLVERIATRLDERTEGSPRTAREAATPGGPLSFAQERLWFLHQLEPAGVAYSERLALLIDAHLDVTAFRAALDEIVRRHHSLRVTISAPEGEPRQIVHDDVRIELPFVDLSSLDDREQRRALLRLGQASASRPFDLERGPLLRPALVRLGERRHAFFMIVHHIVWDGASHGIFVAELRTLYQAFSRREPSPLAELALQYPAYAARQRRRLSDAVVADQLAYWRGKLADLPPLFELPYDRPRPAVQSFRGAAWRCRWDGELRERLDRLGKGRGVTRFMILTAAFKVLLARYSGRRDVVIGTPVTDRSEAELEGMIGIFVNALVLRTEVSGEASFLDLLEGVRQTCREAFAHQDLPFERLVEELARRDLAFSPLFQILFVLQKPRSLGEDAEAFRPLALSAPIAKFDLQLDVVEADGALHGTFEVNRDLFDMTTLRRLARHYETLLEGILRDPARSLSEVPLLGRGERHQLVVEWAETARIVDEAGHAVPVGVWGQVESGERGRFLAGGAVELLTSASESATAPVEEVAEAAAWQGPRGELEGHLSAIWRDVLGLERVGLRDSFFDLGGHSLLLTKVRRELRRRLELDVAILDLFRYPTIAELAARLAPGAEPRLLAETSPKATLRGPVRNIAVIGLAGRFPGAGDVEAFWRNLCAGVESLASFSDDELREAGIDEALLARSDFVKRLGLVDGVADFDAAFFGMTPREAELVDPQQRLFLECAFSALERAGYDPARTAARIGVFAGAGLNRYWANLFAHPELFSGLGEMPLMLANDKDYLATRVSYKLNLRGPSVNVQTACSTSLVAAHLACQSLRRGECDMALAGGSSLAAFTKGGYLYQEGGIASPDGHCRPFDAAAAGTVGSGGAGVVVLKPLERALADGDAVMAVIKGSAINNDGAGKVGFTAPSIRGQATAIAAALAAGDVDPATVDYIEAHGTATALGDPIEVAALAEALGNGRRESRALGSLKSNIGHADAAAGVAGLIKTTLALERGVIPPSLHFTAPNPQIDFVRTGLEVVSELTAWGRNGHPRRAGVSSFGLGGTNAHMVLEEAPPLPPSTPSRPWQVIVLSAKSVAALDRLSASLADALRDRSPEELELADVAFTLQVGRRELEERRVLVCRDLAALVAGLDGEAHAGCLGPWDASAASEEQRLGFLLPGQGLEPGLGRELYDSAPVFRQWVDRGRDVLTPLLDADPRQLLFDEDDRSLLEPRSTEPLLFLFEVALARQWRAWGVDAAVCVGRGVGELAAACLARVFTFEDGLALAVRRGELLARLPRGEAVAVGLDVEALQPLLGVDVELLSIDDREQCTVAGPATRIDELARRLRASGVAVRRLGAAALPRSTALPAIAEAFRGAVAKVELRPPERPFLSNVTGTWITATEATDPAYWARQLGATSRFADGLAALAGERLTALLEVGPGSVLGALGRRSLKRSGQELQVLSSLPEGSSVERAVVLAALGRLWARGLTVAWPELYAGEHRRRVVLPGYPFERQRFWVEPGPIAGPHPRTAVAAQQKASPASAARRLTRCPLDDWFYVPHWKPAPPLPARVDAAEGDDACWLIFADRGGLGDELAARLRELGQTVRMVRHGSGATADEHRVDPENREDYAALCRDLAAEGLHPRRVIHLWSLDEDDREGDEAAPAASSGLASVLYLVQAVARAWVAATSRLVVVTDRACRVELGDAPRPSQATVGGLLRVCAQEIAQLRCQSVDVVPAANDVERRRQAEQVLAEAAQDGWAYSVAYRRGRRFVQGFAPLPLPAGADRFSRSTDISDELSFSSPPNPLSMAGEGEQKIQEGGVYLLTGGLGQIGLALAEDLATRYRAKLVLVGRRVPPSRKAWAGWLSKHGEDDPTSVRIRRLRAIEKKGGELLVLAADVADRERMAEVLAAAEERFGALDGVFHLAGESQSFLCPVEETDAERCAEQLRAKARGIEVLDELLGEKPLAFRVLFSSLSTVLGGLGFAAYAAANSYLDAFAQARSASSAPWLSIAWDGWRFAAPGEARSPQELSLDPGEGMVALERLLAVSGLPQVVVSTAELEGRIATWVAPGDDVEAAIGAAADEPSTAPAASEPAAGGDLEERVRTIWREILGVEHIASEDNFFDLGGDSLAGIQMISRLRRQLETPLSLRHLFAAPTLSALVAHLAGQNGEAGAGAAPERDVLAELLNEIESEGP